MNNKTAGKSILYFSKNYEIISFFSRKVDYSSLIIFFLERGAKLETKSHSSEFIIKFESRTFFVTEEITLHIFAWWNRDPVTNVLKISCKSY